MKAKTKLPVIIFMVSVLFLLQNRVFGQAYTYSLIVSSPINHGELQTNNGVMAIMTGNGTAAGTAMTAFGVNQPGPNYMTDILGIFVGDGVNVNGPSNAVGYSIGGALNGSGNLYPQMFLWHSGDTTSVYCGIHAGYSTPHASSAASYNTFVGNQTGINFAGTGGIWNTAVGYNALLKNTGGVSGSNYYGCKNVAIGDFALESLTSNLTYNGFGNSNTAVGWAALQLFTPVSADLQSVLT